MVTVLKMMFATNQSSPLHPTKSISMQSFSSVDIESQSLSQCTPRYLTPETASPAVEAKSISSSPSTTNQSVVSSETVVKVAKHVANYLSLDDATSLCTIIDFGDEHRTTTRQSCPKCASPLPELIGLTFESDSFEEELANKTVNTSVSMNRNRNIQEALDSIINLDLHQRRMEQKYLRDMIFEKNYSIRSFCLLTKKV